MHCSCLTWGTMHMPAVSLALIFSFWVVRGVGQGGHGSCQGGHPQRAAAVAATCAMRAHIMLSCRRRWPAAAEPFCMCKALYQLWHALNTRTNIFMLRCPATSCYRLPNGHVCYACVVSVCMPNSSSGMCATAAFHAVWGHSRAGGVSVSVAGGRECLGWPVLQQWIPDEPGI
jgi:hypothetical protein